MSFADIWGSPSEDPRIHGIFIGIVTNNKDPEELGRIKVKFPKISADHETDWVRIATLFTGADYGSFFLPQVNDEVLVGFENGNINAPYILGSLWNGKDKPPEKNSDGKNNIGMFKSRSGHIIKFTEESGKEKIEIIDKTTKNMIIIDSKENKISIVSEKDIEIKAPNGKITLDANEITATGKTKVNLVCGGSSVELTSAGTNVKGTVINLN